MKAFITGIGWVSPSGMGRGRDRECLPSKDGKLPKLTSKLIFGSTSPHFGRLDAYSKLGIAAIASALKDAGLSEGREKRSVGIIASTVYGCLNADIDYLDTTITHGGKFASPSLFACTLPNTFLGEAGIHFGLTGPAFVVHEAQLSGIPGLRMALTNMAVDGCPIMLAGVCDPGCPPSFARQETRPPGALFFVLERAPGRQAVTYGEVAMGVDGNVLVKGMPVKDLESLLKSCLDTQATSTEQRA